MILFCLVKCPCQRAAFPVTFIAPINELWIRVDVSKALDRSSLFPSIQYASHFPPLHVIQ